MTKYVIPTLYDVDFGHTDPLMTILIGVEVELDATAKHFRLCESWNVARAKAPAGE